MVTHMKTTIEISDALLTRAKRMAARESTTLRDIVERGLRQVLRGETESKSFKLRDARVNGRGVQQGFEDASWDRIRDAAYEGRGA
jgi:Arc/MetJ family transcription regulator